MMIPLINPARPPKKWFYRTVRELSRAGKVSDPYRVAGWIWFHQMSDQRKREILQEEKQNPAKAGRSPSTGKGSTMTRKTRKRRASAHRRIAPLTLLPTRHSRRRRHRSSGISHRPVLYRTITGGWNRPPRSKLFSQPTMINPFHRGRFGRRHRRGRRGRFLHNPFKIKQLVSRQYLMGTLVIGGGIAAGFLAMPLVTRLANMLKLGAYRPYFGIGHVVLGGAIAMLAKQRMLKELGLVIAGVGAYDLVASNLPLGLPTVSATDWLTNLMPKAAGSLDHTVGLTPSVPMRGSYETGLAASYPSSAFGEDVMSTIADAIA